MKKTYLALPLAAMVLAGCGGNVPSSSSSLSVSSSESTPAYDIKWVSPVGAPALAFYDLGNNTNWVSSSTPATDVVPSFRTVTYDAIVFDGVKGLNITKANSLDWKLAGWLTGGNMHLVSTKHQKDELPTKDSKFYSFNSGDLPDLVFKKLASSSWKWGFDFTEAGNITYADGVSAVATMLSGNNQAYDYFLIAEPALTSAKAALKKNAETASVVVNEIFDLRAEWKTYSGQEGIPQAGLFVRGATYSAHKEEFNSWLDNIGTNLTKATAGSEEAVAALNAYSSDALEQQKRFGFNSTLVNALQKDGKNAFGLLPFEDVQDPKAFVNSFYEKINGGTTSFDSSFFLDKNA